jgi:deoxyribose-phosphate aldolase
VQLTESKESGSEDTNVTTRTFNIALGADHGGFELKEQLKSHLRERGHSVRDLGTNSTEPVDYPKIARAVADLIASKQADFGICVDGAGIGSAMTANKVQGVLAAACYNEALARNSREHNDANFLSLGSTQVDVATAKSIVDIFLTTECTVDRHQRRANMIREIDKGTRAGAGSPDVAPEDLVRIAEKVRELLQKGGASQPASVVLPPDKLVNLIDHTLLKPEAMAEEIDRLCREAIEHGFYSVCVNSSWVKRARQALRGSKVKLCSVVGFPLGAQDPQVKALEARRALREGANEIDMVINIGAVRDGDDLLVSRDIRGVVEACKDSRAICKVILETALLTDEEKVRACKLSMKAGADFVKTSTGFSKGGATVEDVRLMATTVAPKKLGVKASGGIRTYADVVKMVEAGATRVGCSASVKIMEEALQTAGKKG